MPMRYINQPSGWISLGMLKLVINLFSAVKPLKIGEGAQEVNL